MHHNQDDYEYINGFKCMIEGYINGENVNEYEIKDGNKAVMNELHIDLYISKAVKYIDLYKIKNENIQKIIIHKCDNCEEIGFTKEEKDTLSRITEEEASNVILSLLEINNVMMTEISILLMIFKKQKKSLSFQIVKKSLY